MAKSKRTPKPKLIKPGKAGEEPKFGLITLPSEGLSEEERTPEILAADQAALNPLGVIMLWKSICNTCHVYCSPTWRNSQQQADTDALPHTQLHHWTGYENRYVTT